MANIIVPTILKPVIDKTEFKDGRVVFFLSFEARPLWVSGIIPGRMLDADNLEGWITYERPPRETSGTRKGIFFFLRKDALYFAKDIIVSLAKQLFPQAKPF